MKMSGIAGSVVEIKYVEGLIKFLGSLITVGLGNIIRANKASVTVDGQHVYVYTWTRK